jgi:hypothetical protein
VSTDISQHIITNSETQVDRWIKHEREVDWQAIHTDLGYTGLDAGIDYVSVYVIEK